jgi:RHS repeat-associated protein
MPFGEVREINGVTNITETDFGYAGQRNLASIGLMDYDARFYSPTLMRFIQPDTIVPNPLSPQSYNRYSYVLNNPLIYIDPTGHKRICIDGNQCFDTTPGTNIYNHYSDTPTTQEYYIWFDEVAGDEYEPYDPPDPETGEVDERVKDQVQKNLDEITPEGIGWRWDITTDWGPWSMDINFDFIWIFGDYPDLIISPATNIAGGGAGVSGTQGPLIITNANDVWDITGWNTSTG